MLLLTSFVPRSSWNRLGDGTGRGWVLSQGESPKRNPHSTSHQLIMPLSDQSKNSQPAAPPLGTGDTGIEKLMRGAYSQLEEYVKRSHCWRFAQLRGGWANQLPMWVDRMKNLANPPQDQSSRPRVAMTPHECSLHLSVEGVTFILSAMTTEVRTHEGVIPTDKTIQPLCSVIVAGMVVPAHGTGNLSRPFTWSCKATFSTAWLGKEQVVSLKNGPQAQAEHRVQRLEGTKTGKVSTEHCLTRPSPLRPHGMPDVPKRGSTKKHTGAAPHQIPMSVFRYGKAERAPTDNRLHGEK
jgi:hypothetical protein